MREITKTLVTGNGTMVTNKYLNSPNFHLFSRIVTLPENSQLRQAGIDAFRLSKNTQNNQMFLIVSNRRAGTIALGIDQVRKLISTIKGWGGNLTIVSK